MKRFFCTTCKRVRRVRRLPTVVDSANVVNRTGVCDWHSSGTRITHTAATPRAKKVVVSTPKVSNKRRTN